MPQEQLQEWRDTGSETQRRRVSVLVVDDNPDDLLIVGRYLRKIPGWDVDLKGCLSLDEAFGEGADPEPDLIFLDYDLGDLTGLDALEHLAARGVEAPVIMLTGMTDGELVLDAFHAGVADYMPKGVLSVASVTRAARNALDKADLSRAVRERNQELERTVQRLRARQGEIESFYHALSHELKTPLTATREFISLVLDGVEGEVDPGQAELLETAVRNCDQLVVFMNDILDASRLDTGKLELEPASEDLYELVQDVASSIEAVVEEADIVLETRCDAEPALAWMDRARIYQVLSNLLSNAIKFTPPGGRVGIRVEDADDRHLRVIVEDDGRGIHPDDQARIFDRLYQTRHQDAALSGGLGMGLFICRELVELHGGHIEVESTLGQGSVFSFTLARPWNGENES